ncbi:hypothetical protein [Allosphingosinicella deserti]|uniref:Uncharacterized protein n=1 Tax=Allosphingosinicella deserti TaxID=2116704 RepID=A0A2P7QSN4_9SPHN|nr:hypothetical protein [Sphingomonas deserti]PSJ40971.1 hypothetical protein C7I55_11980 [Sphingomonas deserti]
MHETHAEENLATERLAEVRPGAILRGKNVRPYGPTLPSLVAYRPEAWRFLRLSRLYGIALGIVSAREDEAHSEGFSAAVMRIDDWKGDFVAYWRSQADLDRYSDALDKAVVLELEEEIVHCVGPPPDDGEHVC